MTIADCSAPLHFEKLVKSATIQQPGQHITASESVESAFQLQHIRSRLQSSQQFLFVEWFSSEVIGTGVEGNSDIVGLATLAVRKTT